MTPSITRTVIFAHPRTGSSNLTYALNLHPQVNLADGPFWHGYGAAHPDERNYVDDVENIPSLERALKDLYSGNLASNRASVRRVFDFLDLEMPEGDEIDYYLDPLRSKINSETTYQLVPNARDLNERFGSDEIGWLFPSQ